MADDSEKMGIFRSCRYCSSPVTLPPRWATTRAMSDAPSGRTRRSSAQARPSSALICVKGVCSMQALSAAQASSRDSP